MADDIKSDPSKTLSMYCMKCRQKVVVSDPKQETFKNGKKAFRGKCPHCGTTTFAIAKSD